MHVPDRQLLETNRKQAAFYDSFHTDEEFNLPSRFWRRLRDRVRSVANVDDRADLFEREVFETIKPKRLLEVGCYAGREQSDWLLGSPWLERYVVIELSSAAIDRFRQRLTPDAASKAELIVGDFIEQDLPRASFDVVYMRSVFHHFPDPSMTVRRVKDLLVPGGSFITFDPIVTNALFRTVRGMYRPFQSDREWEWPLRHAAFEVLGQELELGRVQGYLGIEMYAAALYTMLPLKPIATLKERARAIDVEAAATMGRGLYRCNLVAMWWRKPA